MNRLVTARNRPCYLRPSIGTADLQYTTTETIELCAGEHCDNISPSQWLSQIFPRPVDMPDARSKPSPVRSLPYPQEYVGSRQAEVASHLRALPGLGQSGCDHLTVPSSLGHNSTSSHALHRLLVCEVSSSPPRWERSHRMSMNPSSPNRRQ
ncbi:hypothetical protein BV25DRAFT_1821355 [Artomyces pyxidatus]|uniref:Uncharacterized protein n=1 Tax=Artomyces pyxidatus TaxID=48021 RepID=A0ACB8TAS5_9AGAM|nr:hypothetical protein BV25DRAFT_1821355 [Artomyces pyxidatus]